MISSLQELTKHTRERYQNVDMQAHPSVPTDPSRRDLQGTHSNPSTANKYQPPQISICERYATSCYGSFGQDLMVYLKVGLPLKRKAAHPAKNQLGAETVVLAVQHPTILLLCWPLHAEKRALVRAQKSPLPAAAPWPFISPHKSWEELRGTNIIMAVMFTFAVLMLLPCPINDK
jgi:hypothetical protein